MAQRYTLADVRRSYTREKRWSEAEGDLPSFLLWRPISILLTPPFLALGATATTVTLLGLLATLALPFAALWGGDRAYMWVAGLAMANHVLDCVDGNIARTTGRSSGTGALLDGFCDIVFWTAYFLSIGILVERFSTGAVAEHGAAIALGLAALVLLHRHLRDAYAAQYAERMDWSPGPPSRVTPFMVARMVVIGLERFYAFGVIAAGLLGVLDGLLVGIGVYVAFIFAAAVGLTFAKSLERDAATCRR